MIRLLAMSLLAVGLLLAALDSPAPAQPSAEQMEAMKKAREGNSGGKPGEPGKPNEEKGKDDDKKPDDAAKVVKRPEKPGFAVDPSELEVKPIDGKVQFNFHGQPWQGVLEWLAAISGLSLDWQELPSDYLNLRTQRAYTLDEARDLINRHLLARGYTMLRHGEVLRVINLDKLDPALVPHVEPAELESRDRHEFVQTTFELDWIPAATAEEELKPLLSPHGKLTKLSTTNRLHAMDVVANLLSIRDLLAEEQSGRGQERLVRSFPLEYARAEDVKASLEDLLGIDESKGPAMPMDPNQMRQMQQRMQQMQQQQQANGGKPGGEQEKQETSIIANPRENQIIATAAPETMQIIEKTIELLDAPPDSPTSFNAQLGRIQVYRLAQLDAETLTKMLEDLGGLDPETVLTADEKNHSIIVNGPIADHYVVQQVIKKLDGSDRTFDVIPLRRLPADYVAGTIRFMMGGEEEKEEDNRSRYYSYSFYGRNNNEDEEAPRGKFRVDADVQGNRLLVYANPIEMEEIYGLLEKLGEIRPQDERRSTIRVLSLTDAQAAEFLRRLEANWKADETHPLVIDPELKQSLTPPSDDADEPAIPEGDPFAPTTAPTDETVTPTTTSGMDAPAEMSVARSGAAHMMLQDPLTPAAQTEPPPSLGETDPAAAQLEPPVEEVPAAEPTPVTIRRGPDGKLIVHSEDPRVLNVVEDLMYELAPPPKGFHVFTLKYPTTYTYDVVWNLEDFFNVGLAAEEEEDDDFGRWYFGYGGGDSEEESPLRLSQRKELKFIPDEYSRTILVQGATPEQLETIEELIALYDQPQSQNSGDLRVTKIFSIEHAKAEIIATAIKDVYRDLLSSNDRALQSGGNRQGQQQRPVAERSYTYVMGGDGGQRDEPEAPVKFKGLLSIGVDEESNTLVVSAAQSLMGNIEQLINDLDTAAQQQEAVSVVRTGGAGVPRDLSHKLKEIFGDKVTIVGAEPEEEPTSDEPVEAERIED